MDIGYALMLKGDLLHPLNILLQKQISYFSLFYIFFVTVHERIEFLDIVFAGNIYLI